MNAATEEKTKKTAPLRNNGFMVHCFSIHTFDQSNVYYRCFMNLEFGKQKERGDNFFFVG